MINPMKPDPKQPKDFTRCYWTEYAAPLAQNHIGPAYISNELRHNTTLFVLHKQLSNHMNFTEALLWWLCHAAYNPLFQTALKKAPR